MRFSKLVSVAFIALLGAIGCNHTEAQSGAPPQNVPAAPAAAPAATPAAEPRHPDVPYVPTPPEVVAEMLKIAGVTKDDVVYDLGSGDGRIVIAAAKDFGARGVGIDISSKLVAEARANAEKAGVADRVKFVEQDLFEANISDATVVTLYLLPDINLKLRPKLWRELKPGTRVVSHSFDMDDWEPQKTVTVNNRTIHFWVVPEDAGKR
jgi:SAM-dependent methyltransferase